MNASRLTFILAAAAALSLALAGCTFEPFADPVPVPANYAPYAYTPPAPAAAVSINNAQPHPQATTAPTIATAPPAAVSTPIIDDATRDQAIAIAHTSILKRFPIDPDPQLNEYLILVGSLVTINTPRPDAEYTYLLLQTDQPVSCALWPKTICISRGLFNQMQDESELAGVIAREISNLIAARPFKAAGLTVPAATQPAATNQTAASNLLVNRLAGKLIDILIKDGFGPDLDQAADVEAAQFAAAAKYAPDGLLRLLTRQKPTTPAAANTAADSSQPANNAASWQRIQALNANLQIVTKAYPASDTRLPARFETYQKPRPATPAANP